MSSDLFPERLETDRLVLEAMTTDSVDVSGLFDVCSANEPDIHEVTRHLTWTPHETPKETAEFLATVTEKREKGLGSEYLIRPQESEADDIIGVTGITVDWDRRLASLGTWLRKQYWGRGYSGERAAAMFAHAFDGLALEVVAVECATENEKSRRAIEKYIEAHGGRREGLVRNGLVHEDGTVVDVLRYSVTRGEYTGSA